MNELIDACVTLVQNSGGNMVYRDLLAATPNENRKALPKALKEARARGLLSQEVKLVEGEVVHTYSLGS